MSYRRIQYLCTAVIVFLIADSIILIHCKYLPRFDETTVSTLSTNPIEQSFSKLKHGSRANKEVNTDEFIRLVLMRLVYGLATTMGVEERLEGVFNGAFVPPNADSSIFGFGNFDEFLEDDGDDYGIF